MVTLQHQDATTVSSSTAPTHLNDILAAVDALSVQDKAALVSHILSGSELSVILSYPAMSFTTAQQVRTMSHEAMGEVLEAIAQHLLDGN